MVQTVLAWSKQFWHGPQHIKHYLTWLKMQKNLILWLSMDENNSIFRLSIRFAIK